MNKEFLCGFHNRTKMSGTVEIKSCDMQCSSCEADQTIIDLRNRIKELEAFKNNEL